MATLSKNEQIAKDFVVALITNSRVNLEGNANTFANRFVTVYKIILNKLNANDERS